LEKITKSTELNIFIGTYDYVIDVLYQKVERKYYNCKFLTSFF